MASLRDVRALVLAAALGVGALTGCTTDPAEDSGDLRPSPQGELDDVRGDGPEGDDPMVGDDGAGGDRDARPQGGGDDTSPGVEDQQDQ
jgi:hypothetical protein